MELFTIWAGLKHLPDRNQGRQACGNAIDGLGRYHEGAVSGKRKLYGPKVPETAHAGSNPASSIKTNSHMSNKQ